MFVTGWMGSFVGVFLTWVDFFTCELGNLCLISLLKWFFLSIKRVKMSLLMVVKWLNHFNPIIGRWVVLWMLVRPLR